MRIFPENDLPWIASCRSYYRTSSVTEGGGYDGILLTFDPLCQQDLSVNAAAALKQRLLCRLRAKIAFSRIGLNMAAFLLL